ncbi:MAG: DUF2029 domain-containing protein, partial [Myxococcales bacterium]|nr:DUF2029 domain-containing protein [Myxococcales bacterium]
MPTLLLSLALALALPDGLDVDDAVTMDDGITYVGLETTDEVDVGGVLKIDLYFTASAPLPADVLNFLHVESGETTCRLVEDRTPPAPVDGIIKHHVELALGQGGPCSEPQRLDIYTGLYHRGTGARVRVVKPASRSDRIYAGHVDIVEEGADTDLVAMQGSSMSTQETLAMMRPWEGWLLAVGGALAFALVLLLLTRVLASRPPPIPDWAPAEPRHERRLKWAMVLIVGIPLAASILAGLDFIKDDAYITFRYAHNAVTGHGLVFNPGERVEGSTTFLWTLLMMPFEALGLDMFQVCEVLGTAFLAGCLVYMTRIGQLVDGKSPWLTALWAPLWIATSSSVAKWSTSGMEQPLAMLLPVASAYFLWRSWGLAERPPEYRRDGLKSGILMGLGALTRPEIHLVALFFGVALLVRTVMTWIREKRFDRNIIWWSVGALAIVVPAHLFRYLYYGSLVPNTFYVKTSDSSLVMVEGLKMLHDMFAFNDTGVLLVLVPFAFVRKERLMEKLLMLAVALSFMFYLVKVGRDEMEWHRLYLPALPFLALLAGSGLVNLARLVTAVLVGLGRLMKLRQGGGLRLAERVPLGLMWLVVVIAAAASFGFTYREMGGFNGRGDLSGNFHPDMGKFLVRHERPGGLCAFQDMGSTP